MARIVRALAPRVLRGLLTAIVTCLPVALIAGLVQAGYEPLHRVDEAAIVAATDYTRARPALLQALLAMADVPADEFPYDPLLGDAYNSRERELTRRVGDLAGWVHLGRTRREAGRIAFRLALRERLLDLTDSTLRLAGALADVAERTADTVWADVTYLQPAQPSTFGHYVSSFAEECCRHIPRLQAAYGGVILSVAPFDEETPTHKTLLSAGVIVVESLNMNGIAPGVYQLVCLPLKIVGIDGAPARAILIDQN